MEKLTETMMNPNRFINMINKDAQKSFRPFNYSIQNVQDEDTTVLDIQGFIGRDVIMEWFTGEESKNTVDNLRKELRAIDSSKIIVNINSGGGDLNAGLVIRNLLQSKNATVITNLYGLSASAATAIHQAGNTRRMPENGSFMLIHRVMFGMMGYFNQNTLAAAIEDQNTIDNDLISMYVNNSNATDAEIAELMDAGEGYGKWINAQTALEMGLVDELFDPADMEDEDTDHMNANLTEEQTRNMAENIRKYANVYMQGNGNADQEEGKLAVKLTRESKDDDSEGMTVERIAKLMDVPESLLQDLKKKNQKDEERNINVIASKEKRERELRLLKIKQR